MEKNKDAAFMQLAIDKAREGIQKGQTPFGACIVSAEGYVVACTHNSVWSLGDITAHGEVQAIREACRGLRTIDLSGCTIYSTTEPCPMCFSAIHWARLRRLVFGASIGDARQAGFNELMISNATMKQESGSSVLWEGGCLRDDCVQLFAEWKKEGKARVY